MSADLIKCQCDGCLFPTGSVECERDATAEDFLCDRCRDNRAMYGVPAGSVQS